MCRKWGHFAVLMFEFHWKRCKMKPTPRPLCPPPPPGRGVNSGTIKSTAALVCLSESCKYSRIRRDRTA